jgi:hypothetical protein
MVRPLVLERPEQAAVLERQNKLRAKVEAPLCVAASDPRRNVSMGPYLPRPFTECAAASAPIVRHRDSYGGGFLFGRTGISAA